MNMLAAYGGFPTRYPHWRFGMDYEQLDKGYEYGLSKIYEMVINTNPSYAYLLENNTLIDQKLVMAHVYGHVDFFKNNSWFSKTNRKMIDQMANHAARVRRHMGRHGVGTSRRLHRRLSVTRESHRSHVARSSCASERHRRPDENGETSAEIPRLRSRRATWTATSTRPSSSRQQKQRMKRSGTRRRTFPEEPQRDVLEFLIQHAPIEDWQRDCPRDHSRRGLLLRTAGHDQNHERGLGHVLALEDHDRASSVRLPRSSTTQTPAPGSWPRRPGASILTSSASSSFATSKIAGTKGHSARSGRNATISRPSAAGIDGSGLGRQKIFDVRKLYNDITFLDEFFTLEFCHEQKFYSFGFNERSGNWEIMSREFEKVKAQLLKSLTNRGMPVIYVQDGNWENKGELLLRHRHEGVDLRSCPGQGYSRKSLSEFGRARSICSLALRARERFCALTRTATQTRLPSTPEEKVVQVCT